MRNIIHRVEEKAMLEAGNAAGAYLDTLGRTDLATLAPEEWRGFLETFLNAYGDAVRAGLNAGRVKR